jgi:two-component system, OmpR family, sensor histidine kinase VicK
LDVNKTIILPYPSNLEELELIPIVADQNRIKQVISNLIDNTIKFTQEGEITITAELVNKMQYQVIIKINDTGAGIDPDVFPKLFSKFATKSDTGTGLGLYICKGIVEAHNGTIWAENNYEKIHKEIGTAENETRIGAIFCFSLPLADF